MPPNPNGLDLAKAFRECHTCGFILVEASRIAQITERAARMLGLNAGEAAGKDLGVLPEPLRTAIQNAIGSGALLENVQCEALLRGGTRARLNISVAPWGSAGEPRAMVALNDVSAARRYEERLALLENLASFGTLSAAVAHEIKNALVAVKTFLELLLEKNRDAELAGIVRREVGRIDALVAQMLGLANPARAEFAPVSLHEVLDGALRLVQPRAENGSIALGRSFQAMPDVVRGDKTQLEQAFLNLFLNGLEAIGSKGSLSIATWTEPFIAGQPGDGAKEAAGRVHISVKDSGAGIPWELQARLFEPFFTTKPSGTGLGLAITQRIIREHQGEIAVESSPGAGTRFEIVIPAMG